MNYDNRYQELIFIPRKCNTLKKRIHFNNTTNKLFFFFYFDSYNTL